MERKAALPVANSPLSIKLGDVTYFHITNTAIPYKDKRVKRCLGKVGSIGSETEALDLLGKLRIMLSEAALEHLSIVATKESLDLGAPEACGGSTVDQLENEGWCGVYLREKNYRAMEARSEDPMSVLEPQGKRVVVPIRRYRQPIRREYGCRLIMVRGQKYLWL